MTGKIKNLFLLSLVTTVASAFVLMDRTADAAVIYVDTGHGSTSAYQTGSNWANVRSGNGTTSNLVDINNVATNIDLTIAGPGSTSTNGLMPASGTDGFNLFEGFVNAVGLISLTNGTITMTFSGLDPNETYDVSLLSNRIDDTIVTADETFVISDADSFANISSGGTIVNISTTSFDTRSNHDGDSGTSDGYLARWNQIAPGADGDFVVTLTAGSGEVAYLNAIRLESVAPVPEPAGILLCLIGSLGIVVVMRRVHRRGA